MTRWWIVGIILGVLLLMASGVYWLNNPQVEVVENLPVSENLVREAFVPVWKLGDNWTLKFTYPQENYRTLIFYNLVVGENLIENRWCYEVKVWSENQVDLTWNYYSKENLSLVGSRVRYATPRSFENTWTVVESLNISRGGSDYDFPLAVGKSWSYSIEVKTFLYLENGENRESKWVKVPTQYSSQVENVENVQVAAGVFESYLIRTEITTSSGTILKLSWFSEEVGWLVKEERFIGENKILEVELLDFSHSK